MTFDEIIAKFIGSQLGSSANKRTAIYFKNLLEDNKTTLDLENSSLSDKMYLYLLYHIDHHQRVVYDTIRNAKKVEDISDDAMIDVFNELISEYSSYSYNRDKLTTYFLSFKTEIDKRPMVGANLVLAGFDIVAKTNNVIKDDQEYARFVDRKVSYPTKQYIKYLTEDNMQYFVMQDVITEGNHRYNAPTISLDNCRNIELIKNNYHLYLMYCLSFSDVTTGHNPPWNGVPDETIIKGETLTALFKKYIDNNMLRVIQKDIKAKKFDINKAKKFISFFKSKLMDNEYDVLKGTIDTSTGGYRTNKLSFSWQTTHSGTYGWGNRTSTKTGKILVETYNWEAQYFASRLYLTKYIYVLLALLYIYKSEIAEDVRSTLDLLKSSYLYCDTSDEWKQKNKSYYSGILSTSNDMNTAFKDFWSLGGKVCDYILKFDFNEPFTTDGTYIFSSGNSYRVHTEERHTCVKEIVDGIESLLNTIGNN